MNSSDNGNGKGTNGKPIRGKPFENGNPGRPRGSRNKTTVLIEKILDKELEDLVRTAIEGAKGGDSQLLKLFLKPLVSQQRRVEFDLPELKSVEEAPQAIAAVLRAVAHGEITVGEGALINAQIAQFAQTVDSAELARRLDRLESTIFSDAEARSALKNSPPGLLAHKP